MSQENVEVVRAFYEAYNARDMDLLASLVAEEFRFRSVFVGVEGRDYAGPTAFPGYFADLDEAWEYFWLELEDVLDAGPNRVLGLMQVHGRGTTSGVEIDPRIAAVFHLRDGKLVGLQTYTNRAAAHEAVGLRE